VRERGVVERARRDCERERDRHVGREGDKKARAGSVVGRDMDDDGCGS
jgi:hypothetical protein